MKHEEIANKIARGIIGSDDVTFYSAVDEVWNRLHDFNDALDYVVHEYDSAGSYYNSNSKIKNNDTIKNDSNNMVKVINKLKKNIKKLTNSDFEKISSLEQQYIKKHGTPEEASLKQSEEFFPN